MNNDRIPEWVVRRAIQSAEWSHHHFRVGAVVWKSKNEWARGCNDATRTHTQSPHPFKTIHAEFAAMLSALEAPYAYPGFLRGYKIYVHRLLADGTPGLAKPCIHCQFMLAQVGIKDIYWSNNAQKMLEVPSIQEIPSF